MVCGSLSLHLITTLTPSFSHCPSSLPSPANHPPPQVARLIELRKHLTPSHRHTMDTLIHELSPQHLLHALTLCDEPFAKHCRLCRVRRLDALEFRMLHDQMPPGMIKVPGAIPVLNVAEIYTADDDKFFSFDVTHGKVRNYITTLLAYVTGSRLADLSPTILLSTPFNSNPHPQPHSHPFTPHPLTHSQVFFKREIVDLVRICGTCLNDVAGAAAANKKFENLYDLTPRTRKVRNRLRGQGLEVVGCRT